MRFPANEYDDIFSGYLPGQMVERRKNQRFEDNLYPHPQGTSLVRVGKKYSVHIYTWPCLFTPQVYGIVQWPLCLDHCGV